MTPDVWEKKFESIVATFEMQVLYMWGWSVATELLGLGECEERR